MILNAADPDPTPSSPDRPHPKGHSISGAMACVMAALALAAWVGGALANRYAPINPLLILILQWAPVSSFCAVGVYLAVLGLTRKRRRKALPALGLLLNLVIMAGFIGYWTWPTPTTLVAAAARGDVPGVERSLRLGVPVNSHVPFTLNNAETDATALTIAAQMGQRFVIQTLIEHGADVNETDRQGQSPLYLAIQASKSDDANKIVSLLLERKADPNKPGPQGSPLGIAAGQGNIPLIEMLLKHGARVNTPGVNPLHEAAAKGSLPIIKLLLDRGADAKAADVRGMTPLHHAAIHGYIPAARELLAHGADLNALDNDGATPLGLALDHGQVDLAAELMALGAKVSVFSAVSLNDPAKLKELLDADKDAVNKLRAGQTPLHQAVRNKGDKALEMVQALIDHRADVNAPARSPDPDHLTPLQAAIVAGGPNTVPIVKLLLEHGGDANAVMQLNGATAPPLYFAIDTGNAPVVQMLLDHAADVNALCKGLTSDGTAEARPLFFAAMENRLDIAKILLASHAETDGRKTDSAPTPLYEAVRQGNVEMVQLLLAHGAKPNAQVAGSSPRALASERLTRDSNTYEKIIALFESTPE